MTRELGRGPAGEPEVSEKSVANRMLRKLKGVVMTTSPL
jgi:hypothetical protein